MVYNPGSVAMLPPDGEYGAQTWMIGQSFHQTVNMVYKPGSLAKLPPDSEYGVQTWKFGNASSRE